MKKVHVVGVGLNPVDIPSRLSKLILDAQVIVGGRRLLDWFEDLPALRIIVQSPVQETLTKIREETAQGKRVVVLADGDPLFFGIGTLLIEEMGKENVVIHPNVTTLQKAAARLGIPWHDIRSVSLHGRKDIMPLLRALVKNDRVAVFTDHCFHPARVAEELIQRGVGAFAMIVLENLETESEKIEIFQLKEAAEKTFSPLNSIILDRIEQPERPLHLGMDDDLYLHQKGLITKKEIRAAGLAALEIMPDHVVWDLGSGSGSVAIEASLLAHNGTVFAVEKNEERVCLIRGNVGRMGAYNVEVIYGEMPGCLADLPDPDRIFVGGGMGRDNQVLEKATKRLKPGGRLVLHLVLIGSLSRAREYLQSLGWVYSMGEINVSRSGAIAGDLRFEALNPVYIITAKKPRQDAFERLPK
ncbi:MAG: precorrin-6y C5,15-methyltransferase (decarboxylating) subunit CbiE [Thermodesulfobacteriota bacterium]|nr:precorrin-6y C5,15-methyltransferase (decarboxylating) subunit CbiE [Thermodesulfobacteriota bacterium]